MTPNSPVTVRAAVVGVQLVDLVGEGRDADPFNAHEVDDVVLRLEAVGRLHNAGPPTQPHPAILLVGELLPLLLREALDLELVEEVSGVGEVFAVALRPKHHHLSNRQWSSFIAKATQLATTLCSQPCSLKGSPPASPSTPQLASHHRPHPRSKDCRQRGCCAPT